LSFYGTFRSGLAEKNDSGGKRKRPRENKFPLGLKDRPYLDVWILLGAGAGLALLAQAPSPSAAAAIATTAAIFANVILNVPSFLGL
jgi:hypothetical protein